MRPIRAFGVGMRRAEHLLDLYDVVVNTRTRKIRKDWALKFKDLMHWPHSETIVRIDGRDKKSILILREELGIGSDRFTHEYASELLRSAHVAAVSALDRYMHDAVVWRSWTLLTRKEDDIPRRMRELPIGALATRKAIDKIREDPKARPGQFVKAAIQEQLHREYTFQGSGGIDKAAELMGIADFWRKVSDRMPGSSTSGEVQTRLNAAIVRRNQIVHEADLVVKTKAKKDTVRPIDRDGARATVDWMCSFVNAVEEVIVAEFA